MYGTFIGSSPAIAGVIQVRSAAEIEYLVKESEVITGKAGRFFFVQGDDEFVYHIELDPSGYKVEALAGEDKQNVALHVLPEHLDTHSLGEALRSGRLFTSSLPN